MNFLFSEFLKPKSAGKKVAFVALFTALSTITNMLLEIKIFDVQFSLSIVFSCVNGIVLGPVFGFLSCFIGDLIGFFINSWGQLYMAWVGISTGGFAFLAGIIFGIKSKDKYWIFVKILAFSIISFIVCTVCINSTGFYLYNRKLGFSDAFLTYVENITGRRDAGFLLYLGYRLIFKGQIFNSLVNYALLFVTLPLIKSIPAVKDKFPI